MDTEQRTRTGELIIPDQTEGDMRVEWDHTNAEQVAIARRAFQDARQRGMSAYRTDNGDRGEVITEFDPEAEQILMAMPMQGG